MYGSDRCEPFVVHHHGVEIRHGYRYPCSLLTVKKVIKSKDEKAISLKSSVYTNMVISKAIEFSIIIESPPSTLFKKI